MIIIKQYKKTTQCSLLGVVRRVGKHNTTGTSIFMMMKISTQAIKAPEGAYTVDCLKVIIHSAKIYIRPSQKDLDLSPCSVDVGASGMSYNALS